jgi:DNA-binding transcriptional MerR regulator
MNALQVFEPGARAVYTIEIAAQMAQVPRRLIVLYYKHGLVTPVTDPAGAGWYFDDEAVRIVRRIEHLRSTCGLNLAGIKLVMSLINEVERLRTELRFHHRI